MSPLTPASATREPSSGRPIRVLESFAEPSARTNPYLTQLRNALAETPGTAVVCWGWRTALLGRYDVFHTHWTEALIERRRGRAATAARRALFAVFLLRLRITRTPIVRTVHNVDLPTGLGRIERMLLRAVDRATEVRIRLNSTTAGDRSVLIEHGHYRDWFAGRPRVDAVEGRLAFVGKVRRYKNVEGLIDAFSALQDSDARYSLHVAGAPTSAELGRSIAERAVVDPRVDLRFGFLDDSDLVREIRESEVVVLPYHEMHNSGSVLAALSLDRPVLVPDSPVSRALGREVGDGWVLTFSGTLGAADLREALRRSRNLPTGARPDLGRRGWDRAGSAHLSAFRTAVAHGGSA